MAIQVSRLQLLIFRLSLQWPADKFAAFVGWKSKFAETASRSFYREHTSDSFGRQLCLQLRRFLRAHSRSATNGTAIRRRIKATSSGAAASSPRPTTSSITSRPNKQSARHFRKPKLARILLVGRVPSRSPPRARPWLLLAAKMFAKASKQGSLRAICNANKFPIVRRNCEADKKRQLLAGSHGAAPVVALKLNSCSAAQKWRTFSATTTIQIGLQTGGRAAFSRQFHRRSVATRTAD